MNKEISVRFQTIRRKMEVYKSTVAATFSLYREGMERARERCKAYKDESGALRQEAVEASVAQVEVESTAGEDLARKRGKAAAERAQCNLSRFII